MLFCRIKFIALLPHFFSLEDLSDSIVQDFAYMRQREEEMRSTNGKIFMVLAVFRSFFEKKTKFELLAHSFKN